MKTKLISTSLVVSLGLLLICSGNALTCLGSTRSLSDRECSNLYAGNSGCEHKCFDVGCCESNDTDCDDYTGEGSSECRKHQERHNMNGYGDWYCSARPDYGECDTSNYQECVEYYYCTWSTHRGCYILQEPNFKFSADVNCSDTDGSHS